MKKDILTLIENENIDSTSTGIFFSERKIFLSNKTNTFNHLILETVDKLKLKIFDFHIDDKTHIFNCHTELAEENITEHGFKIFDIKNALLKIHPNDHYKILKNYHWINWNMQSKYCGSCGSLLEKNPKLAEKKCTFCNSSYFPRFSPAILVLIYHEDKILLARSPHFPPGDYSVIAGFIDLGESAEQAVHREVKEELGIEVTDLEYIASQTWPFPDSFMIAFKARYLRGEINIDTNEIEDAQWFSKENLPNLPSSTSIARQLIDDFVQA